MYFPISGNHLLIFLDPARFEIDGQHPETTLEKISVNDPAAIHEVNKLQVISAFHEIFGPVGHGNYLEGIVDELTTEFNDEESIRGYTGEQRRVQLAYLLASGFANSPWHQNYGREIIRAEEKRTNTIWKHEHDIDFVCDLSREDSLSDYW